MLDGGLMKPAIISGFCSVKQKRVIDSPKIEKKKKKDIFLVFTIQKHVMQAVPYLHYKKKKKFLNYAKSMLAQIQTKAYPI